ncbi:hypothetical protein L226DRAFT_191322 [Lentinus tigrinus ALCF2SS1-7]|uniref:Uncharacterized protein n=1 Tax=Lentinus tigrinus ALCF2SS1-6 TaxID=1328759 RepID=A0A5C2SQR4_9APHY|nr:hypothetical protein L227DRAFT_135812 [Lentinus tigrinus ALCF2SS1-6]RPD80125.1 hypothetical protein L226DRAFT_191322 [Lentinus tigrinus ALCF2SS1-7]
MISWVSRGYAAYSYSTYSCSARIHITTGVLLPGRSCADFPASVGSVRTLRRADCAWNMFCGQTQYACAIFSKAMSVVAFAFEARSSPGKLATIYDHSELIISYSPAVNDRYKSCIFKPSHMYRCVNVENWYT